jgi:NADPH:quinone reductase-like Zn-dependent oxidoreductase
VLLPGKVIFPTSTDVKRILAFVVGPAGKEKFRPMIDRTYPLQKIRDAFEYVESGQKTGNVVLTME